MPLVPPAITPRARPSQPSPVVVHLSTALTISDFPAFYPDADPDAFRPIYYALPDGSLLAPPLRRDLTTNSVLLLITGCLLSVFLRNLGMAAIYLCRGKIKKKGLLYTIFLSQLLGPIAIIPIIVAQFTTSANCAVILRITFLACGLSLSLLVTGVFGVKAYRCLDNNRLVSTALVALRTAGTVVLILDMIDIHTLRTLSGHLLVFPLHSSCSCLPSSCSFPHASSMQCGNHMGRWRSVVRISVPLSLDEVTDSLPTTEGADSVRNRRGWLHTDHFSTSPKTPPLSRQPSIPSTPRDESQGTHTFHTETTTRNSERPAPIPSTTHTHTPAPRSWTVRMPTPTDSLHPPARVATPPTFSTRSPISRFPRYIPRMSLFREVMRDELCYTAITAAFTVVSATMTLVGVKSANGIDATIWVTFDWAVISLLVMHSFGRAIRRHEDESLLLHPSARYHDLHTDRTTAELLGDVPKPVRIPGVLSRARAHRSAARYDLDGGASPSKLSMHRLFPESAHSSRADLHSLATSTSRTSNEPFSRTQVSSTVCTEDGPSRSQNPPEEWFNKNLFDAPPPPEPPDEGRS
ncbi:hypothetical protein HD554DRAFT_1374334 [Boletus coccyginus]|nr:hypothetical protein HD554DRAFT_1374334 [Boletus coccyginus]